MTTQILADRAALEREIDGRTLIDSLAETVAQRGDSPAYSDRLAADGWRTVTWRQLHQRSLDIAAALIDAGLQAGDTVALMCSSRIEHVLADLAVVHAGGTPMSVYDTLAPEQVSFIAGHAAPSIVVLEGEAQLARWAPALAAHPEIQCVVVIESDGLPDDPRTTTWAAFEEHGRVLNAADSATVSARAAAVRPEDALTILYTSGTTGRPKGVVLTHHNILFEAHSSLQSAGIDGPGISLSYLPFAHIAERILGMYVPQIQGGHVHLIGDPALLAPSLLEVRPTRFFGVPRVWEKIRTGVSARLAAEPDEARKAAVAAALAIGLEYVESQQTGNTTSPELAERFAAVDGSVLGPLRAALGLDRVEWAASAAAPMPVGVARFFAGLGLSIYDVYGMTETSSSVTANGPGSFRLGTVGKTQRGLEVRVAGDGEILVRGPIVTPGYHRAPEATAGLVDADGWVHTGDIGEIDDEGFLRVVDRKSEMIITSSGKNIAPSNVENLVKESPLIGHAMVVGEGRPYLVAVLTLDPEIAPLLAQRLGIDFTSLADLARHPAILAAVGQAIEAANARLSRPEQVKAFELLPEEWTAESEELTPTLKLKRRVVTSKHSDIIDRLYGIPDEGR